MSKVKPRGRIPGSPKVPHDAYTAIVLLYVLWQWTKYDIGRLWGIKPITVGAIIRRRNTDVQ